MNEGFAGIGTSTAKVVELYYPENQRIIDDPIAYELLPFWWKVLVRMVFLPGLRNVVLALREKRMPGSLGGFLCRGRYIDDVLKSYLSKGTEQVVILGAGFDSRAYRIEGIDRAQVFEIDLPGASKVKRSRVEKVLGNVPDNVALIGLDFEQQSLEEVVQVAGYQKEKKTFFIWEGVTQYLTPEAVDNSLNFVSQYSGTGSAVVFTYVRKGIIDGTDRPEWLEKFLPLAKKLGSPWLFGLESAELEQFLHKRGLRLIGDVGTDDYKQRYLDPIGRKLSIFEGERAALAEVIK
ncbi:MAG: class I SAM-dependent methyltransferase [Anaerolineales bacterium]|nr:class I SAM-dependent methyltransferase [Anaerolineales bacterium]